MEPHDEFIELCAVSTSGELSEQEQRKLEAHLAGCAECRQALQEFEAAVDLGVPFLASKLSPVLSLDSSEPFSIAPSEVRTDCSARASRASLRERRNDVAACARCCRKRLCLRSKKRTRAYEGQLELCVVAVRGLHSANVALGIYSYRMGKSRSVEVTQKTSPAPDMQIEALEQQMSDAGHERNDLRTQLAQRDRVISDLRHEIQMQSASLDEMKSAQANLEKSIQNDEGEKQQSAQDRDTLAQKLETAQASLQKTQTQLESLERQRAQDESRADSLAAQVNDLHAQLRDREQTVNKEEDSAGP